MVGHSVFGKNLPAGPGRVPWRFGTHDSVSKQMYKPLYNRWTIHLGYQCNWVEPERCCCQALMSAPNFGA
jgi:hypothetical protein